MQILKSNLNGEFAVDADGMITAAGRNQAT